MKITEFGVTKNGENAKLYTILSDRIECRITDYGTTLVNLLVPDRDGKQADIVLGYDDVKGYEEGDVFIGANVGRNANRIGGAVFTLNGAIYQMDRNDGENNLHSGFDYQTKRIWTVEEYKEDEILFSLESPHMDQGFPGAVKLYVKYEVSGDCLKISYHGTPDRDTVINMTNHSYFNLNGQGSGKILGHSVRLAADHFTPTDAGSIPTGEIAGAAGTPMDFTVPKIIGRDIEADFEPLHQAGGYDHNFCLNDYDGTMKEVVEASGDLTGIRLRLTTDYPGLQMYSGNYLVHEKGKGGNIYSKRDGVCFEPQFFPDAVNKPQFVSPVCKAGALYAKNIEYRFDTI